MPGPNARKKHLRAADLLGTSKLVIDATIGLTNLVENMHHNISRAPGVLGMTTQAPTSGITGLVYRTIRGVTRAVGGGLNLALGQLVGLLNQEPSSHAREGVVAALNGVLGDHLVDSSNPLAISMQMRCHGEPLILSKKALSRAIQQPGSKIMLLVHGLCLGDLQWQRNGHDNGAMLAADAAFASPASPAIPFTPVYLHYNSGLHISLNGSTFADQLEALVKAWPVAVEELAIVAHSMGGLVTRSACHAGAEAGHVWLQKLRKIIFLGTPHFGAPLERGGNWINVVLDASPYTAAFARLAKIRSAGITDLRHAGVRTSAWEAQDRFAPSGKSHPGDLPLPAGVKCYAIAAVMGKKSTPIAGKILGDGLVPEQSALGQHKDPRRNLAIPKSRQWVGYEMNHLDLLDRQDVYRRIRKWLLERA